MSNSTILSCHRKCHSFAPCYTKAVAAVNCIKLIDWTVHVVVMDVHLSVESLKITKHRK